VIDLLWLSQVGVVVTDFKTGQEREEHAQQVNCYALVWRRLTGMTPVRAELRYPNRIKAVAVDAAGLDRVERELAERIERLRQELLASPAPARPGEHCPHCPVRSFCDAYWVGRTPGRGTARGAKPRSLDLEVRVAGAPTRTGFDAALSDGRTIRVVYEEGLWDLVGTFTAGGRLRLLGAHAESETAVELKPWTEAFRLC
jgi:hypothetical protein